MLHRRAFFQALAAGSAAAPLLLALPKTPAKLPLPLVPPNPCGLSSAEAITQIVAREALMLLQQNLLVGNLVNRHYEPSICQAGDTINIPIAPILYSHGPPPSLGNAQFVLQHIEANFCVPSLARALADPKVVEIYLKPAILALSERIERDLLTQHHPYEYSKRWRGNNAPFVGWPGRRINEFDLDLVETQLFNARVPLSLNRFLVLHTEAYSDIRKLKDFVEYNGDKIFVSFGPMVRPFARYKTFWVFHSQNARAPLRGTKSDWGNFTGNLAFASDAFALVTHKLPDVDSESGAISAHAASSDLGLRVVMPYNPKSLAQHFTVDILYGAGVLRENFAVQVLS